jgi:hypothetical protein
MSGDLADNGKAKIMKNFKVYCGMRPDSGRFAAYTSSPTMFRTVTVQAKDVHDARAEAIDECYRQWGNSIEHVVPLRVTELES